MFHLSPEYLTGLLILAAIVILSLAKKLPSAEGFDHFLHALDSRGGNLLLLAIFTFVSYEGSIKLIYFVINHNVSQNPATIAGISWVTGAAFGGFSSTLFKAMSGQNGTMKKPDSPVS